MGRVDCAKVVQPRNQKENLVVGLSEWWEAVVVEGWAVSFGASCEALGVAVVVVAWVGQELRV